MAGRLPAGTILLKLTAVPPVVTSPPLGQTAVQKTGSLEKTSRVRAAMSICGNIPGKSAGSALADRPWTHPSDLTVTRCAAE